VVQHYDLGNDFYAAWLDETMTYSSAWFERDDLSLADAQRAKMRRLAERTGVRPGDRVLEIGSGWGAFACMLAEELGCSVTTVTVSRAQHEAVGKLVAERGLADRVDPRLQDFEALTGTFDRVVSVEMMESIPRTRWPAFYRQLRDRLRPGGTAGLQLIVVADRHWRGSDDNPDFVRRYVFPGGQVPSPAVLRALAASSGLEPRDDAGFAPSYARTLAAWLQRFDAAWPRIAEMGFDERFRRMWRYYLSYCGAGFASGRTDVRQLVLARP
jgi:cyclopropane-fatty-acyl-phospholipid synthase